MHGDSSTSHKNWHKKTDFAGDTDCLKARTWIWGFGKRRIWSWLWNGQQPRLLWWICTVHADVQARVRRILWQEARAIDASIYGGFPKFHRLPWEPPCALDATDSSISSNYYQQRLKLARKLGNPRLLKIGFHTFRHWKLAMVVHEFRGSLLRSRVCRPQRHWIDNALHSPRKTDLPERRCRRIPRSQ